MLTILDGFERFKNMYKVLLLFVIAQVLISCAKRRECLSENADELYIVILDSIGNNLISTQFDENPIAYSASDPSEVSQRLELNKSFVMYNGINQEALKFSLSQIQSDRSYQILNEPYSYVFTISHELKNTECRQKKYKGFKLNSTEFNDTVFIGSGVHAYLMK